MHLDSFLYIALLKMGGLARLFMTNATIEGLQLPCLRCSQAKDVEVSRTLLGTKWVVRKKTKRHFCFLLTYWKLSQFRTTRMLYFAKMTVVLLSVKWAQTYKQNQSHSMNIRMAADQKEKKHTSVTSLHLLGKIPNRIILGKPKKLKLLW